MPSSIRSASKRIKAVESRVYGSTKVCIISPMDSSQYSNDHFIAVVGVNLSKEKSLNAPERFEKAFKDVPRNIWRLFENATEFQSELESLKEDVNADTNADK